jgi:hypothetical protein
MLFRIGELTLRIPWTLRVATCSFYAVLLTWLLLAPAETVSRFYPDVPGLDKVMHFCLFGFLVLIARWALPDPATATFPGLLILFSAFAYGAGIEVMQGLLVQYHRSFEWRDIAANSLGAASFWLLSVGLYPAQPRLTCGSVSL